MVADNINTNDPVTTVSPPLLCAGLLKGPVWRSKKPEWFDGIIRFQRQIEEYFSPLGIKLRLSELDGVAAVITMTEEERLQLSRSLKSARSQDITTLEDYEIVPEVLSYQTLKALDSEILLVLDSVRAEQSIENDDPFISKDQLYEEVSAYKTREDGKDEIKYKTRFDQSVKRIEDMNFISSDTYMGKPIWKISPLIGLVVEREELDSLRTRLDTFLDEEQERYDIAQEDIFAEQLAEKYLDAESMNNDEIDQIILKESAGNSDGEQQ